MKKFVSVVVIIVLAVVLGGLYFANVQQQTQISKDLEARAAASGENVSTVDVTSESDSENVVSDSAGTGEEESEAVASSSVSTASTAESDTVEKAIGISIRGDNYNTNRDADSYASDLQTLLSNAGINIPVEDNTVDMAGSLTQMLYAGVDQQKIDAYISAHQSAANASGITPVDTEIMVRKDISAQPDRDDQDYVPVIFMGYYGGWNNDLQELIDQQHLILDTYNQQDKYIIVGFYPSGFADTQSYDKTMQAEWGEHYLPINSVITSSALSSQGRQEIAQAIYNKLSELHYI